MLYRVLVRFTNSLQPGRGQTFWSDSCIYCGEDKQEARRIYWSEECNDYERGYGNACRRTKLQEIPEAASVEEERPRNVDAGEKIDA